MSAEPQLLGPPCPAGPQHRETGSEVPDTECVVGPVQMLPPLVGEYTPILPPSVPLSRAVPVAGNGCNVVSDGQSWTLRSLIPLSLMTSLLSGSLWRNRVTHPPLRLLGTLSEPCLKGTCLVFPVWAGPSD